MHYVDITSSEHPLAVYIYRDAKESLSMSMNCNAKRCIDGNMIVVMLSAAVRVVHYYWGYWRIISVTSV